VRRAPAAGHRPTCYRCFKPTVTCICASIERVANRTGLIVLQHPHERFHPVGSARIAALGFETIRVEPCAPWSDHSAVGARLPEGAALLYPAAGARELEALPVAERPRHLVVLDGTWSHAKKMYDAHAWLRGLPHVRLVPRLPSQYRIRRQPKRDCLATLEAIVCALGILEPETKGLERLLACFSTMVDRQATHTPAPTSVVLSGAARVRAA
jgi:DTW domain-containing protein